MVLSPTEEIIAGLQKENEMLRKQLDETKYMIRIMNFYRNCLDIIATNPAMPKDHIMNKIKQTRQFVSGVQREWKTATEPVVEDNKPKILLPGKQ